MVGDLHLGMTIYHITDKTKAIITEIEESNITIELSTEIASKKCLKLPITHIGEWLFWEEDDISKSYETLAKMHQYLRYGNKNIAGALGKIEEKQKMIAKRKLILINKLIKEFLFDGFHHYTEFSNFVQIMNNGYLFCRNEAAKICFQDAAEQSVIDKTDQDVFTYVRFYYKERTPTNYINEGIKIDNTDPHMPIPVLLLFNEDIIYYDDVAFTSGCGGSKHSEKTRNIEEALHYDWKTVFSRGKIIADEDDIAMSGYDTHKANIINKRNAEFLYRHQIEADKIKKIIFRCPADMKNAISIIGANDLFEVNPQKFNNHRNFLFDYIICSTKTKVEVNLIFNQPYQDYAHKLSVFYLDGRTESIDLCIPNERVKSLPATTKEMHFLLIPLENEAVKRIEYFMNGHRSAVWEEQIND